MVAENEGCRHGEAALSNGVAGLIAVASETVGADENR